MTSELLEPIEVTAIRRMGAEYSCDGGPEDEGMGWPHPAEVTVFDDEMGQELNFCSWHFFQWMFAQGHREVCVMVVP